MASSPNHWIRTRLARLVATVALAATAIITSLVFASPAQAIVQSITCTGTVEQSWNPGITNTPATVTYSVTMQFTNCSGTTSITSGTITQTATYPAQCLVNSGPGSATIDWNDTTNTAFNFQGLGVTSDGSNQVFTATGTVTSGRFDGGTVTFVNTFAGGQFNACSQPGGLTHLSGQTTLQIIKLL